MESQTIDLHIGAIFDTKAALVHICRTHTVQNNFEYGTTKSDKTRYRIHCKQAECPWSLYASTLETTQRFCIKKFHSEHTCFGLMSTMHQQVTERFISIVFERLTAVLLQQGFKRKYNSGQSVLPEKFSKT
jgi:hypothetical protein